MDQYHLLNKKMKLEYMHFYGLEYLLKQEPKTNMNVVLTQINTAYLAIVWVLKEMGITPMIKVIIINVLEGIPSITFCMHDVLDL